MNIAQKISKKFGMITKSLAYALVTKMSLKDQ